METWQAPAIAAVFVLAGAVKGITGMGLPTVAVSLLCLWLTPPQAAALLVVPSLLTNIAQCRGPHARRLAARLWPTWLALAVVTILLPEGSKGTSIIHPHLLLGSVLVAYGLWGLRRPELPDLSRLPAWPGLMVGAASGFVAATTAVFVLPLVPYLQALRLEREALIQALGLSFTVSTLALAVRLQGSQTPVQLSAQTAVALGGALAGLWLGARVRQRIGLAAFQRSLFLVFIALGAASLLQGL